MITLILLALLVGGVTFTITTTSIFAIPREWLSGLHPKVEELIHCPWCLAHWTTFVLMAVCGTEPWPFSPWFVLDWPLTAFAVVAMSGPLHFILLRAYEPVAKHMMYRHMLKRQEAEELEANDDAA